LILMVSERLLIGMRTGLAFFLSGALISLLAFQGLTAVVHAQGQEETVNFEIKAFTVEGNTLFSEREILPVLEPFSGAEKTADDVEQARDRLERFHHEKGYPTVLVNIPEQTVEQGMVRLQVIESKIGRVKVTGNRYFTKEKILKDLPAFRAGEIPYVPKVQEQLNRVNRSPDLKVAPVLMPGKELGSVDVELKVKDRRPLHGSLEVNNRSTQETSDLRVNAMVRYDNLWQKDHSIGLQYQTSPEDMDEVEVVAASYVLPVPWSHDHVLALYGIWSDSDTAFGEGFEVIGKGFILGSRYVMSLPPYKQYTHNLTVGLDYKDFDETTGFADGEEDVKTPIAYLPLSLAYSSFLPDSWGHTRFSTSMNVAFRGLVTDQREFEIKRYEAKGNYLYATAGVERTQKLPADMSLYLKLDGQLADQPLISNEQYSAGGMESVRGYKETEALGDDAFHATAEVIAPNLAKAFELSEHLGFTPYLFYDVAALRVKSPLPGQDGSQTIQGAGLGVRGYVSQFLSYQSDWAVALSDTEDTDRGDSLFHFRVKCEF